MFFFRKEAFVNIKFYKMKRIFLLFSIAVFATVGTFAQKNKKSKVPAKPVITNEADTLSYAYGVTLADQGLKQYLVAAGIVADTAIVRQTYTTKIETEADPAKRAKLNKELAFKVDSILAQNKVNSKMFFDGITESLNTDAAKSAYYKGSCLGVQFGEMIESFSLQIYPDKKNKMNNNLFMAGFLDFFNDEKLLVDDAKTLIETKSQQIQADMQARQQKEQEAQYADKIKEAHEFMKANANKPNVISTPSGLQFEVLHEGAGARPVVTDKVKVHYRGTLTDGTVFDSSIDRGEPISFNLNGVIKGWTEALQLMPVGSKWRLYIPYELAYGSRDTGVIPPYSNLIFEVELLDIVDDGK